MLNNPINLNVVGSITTSRYTRFFLIVLNIDKRVSFIVHVQTPGKSYFYKRLVLNKSMSKCLHTSGLDFNASPTGKSRSLYFPDLTRLWI